MEPIVAQLPVAHAPLAEDRAREAHPLVNGCVDVAVTAGAGKHSSHGPLHDQVRRDWDLETLCSY